MRTSRWAALGLAAALTVGAAGCGDDEGGGGGGGGGAVTADPSTVEVNSTPLGDVLTDGSGLTLYLFTKDTATTSACEGDCLAAWPALEGEPTAGDGADASLIGTIQRSDGTTQATYAGHPLYYYASDEEAGDVTGQGVQDVWWVLDATGAPVEEMPAETSDPGGY